MLRQLRVLSCLVSTALACTPRHEPAAAEPAGIRQESRDADGTRKVWYEVNGRLHGRVIVYQPNGIIGAIFHFQHGLQAGPQYRFYPTGRPLLREQARDGALQGPSYRFYPSGRVELIRHLSNGKRMGAYREFYDLPGSPPLLISRLAVVNGKTRTNGYIVYDSLGRVTDRWGFARVRAAHDTVALGDSLTLHLGVRYPKEPHVLAALGDFDAAFRLRDASSLRVIYGRHHQVTVRVPARQRGAHVARGYLSDYKLDPAERRAGVTGALERQIYFAYPYYVR